MKDIDLVAHRSVTRCAPLDFPPIRRADNKFFFLKLILEKLVLVVWATSFFFGRLVFVGNNNTHGRNEMGIILQQQQLQEEDQMADAKPSTSSAQNRKNFPFEKRIAFARNQ